MMKMTLPDRRKVLAGCVLCGALPAFAATGIDRSQFVPAGGLDQWVGIRGDNAENPVLLVVHGGPGEAQWPMASKYVPWEKDFTVALWDQRGAGHTYGRYGARTPEVNLERIARDGLEIADYLCRTLSKRKIILLGHSWGTTVAARMLQLKPQLFAAYVGTGQVESWKASVQMQFDLLLARARRDNDMEGIRMLEAIGKPDPANADQFFSLSSKTRALWPASDTDWIAWQRANIPVLLKDDPKALKDFIDGFDFSARSVLPDQMKADLTATAARVDTAFFLIQGENDVVTPTAAAKDYFDKVQAPQKAMIIIPDAGHFAFMTSPKFLAALVQTVRPAAIARGA